MQSRFENGREAGEIRKLLELADATWKAVRRRWWLLVISLAFGCAMATVAIARSRTSYRATARLLVMQQSGRPLHAADGVDPLQHSPGATDSMSTQMLILGSPLIIGRSALRLGKDGSSASAIIRNLVVRQPDDTANVIELAFRSVDGQEASRTLEAILETYREFLKEKFQKSSSDAIALIVRARDELSRELKSLEAQYLESRQKTPAYAADDRGRPFVLRRLDQWDQAMNQLLTKSLELKTQVELGRKLTEEGRDEVAIINALGQVAGAGWASDFQGSPLSDGVSVGGESIAKLRMEAAELESNETAAEHVVATLRSEYGESAGPSRDKWIQDFYAEPDVARVRDAYRAAVAKVEQLRRRSRSSFDPALTLAKSQVEEIANEHDRLWRDRWPKLGNGPADLRDEGAAALRKAEAELLTIQARRSAVEERLQKVTEGRLQALRREREQLVRARGEAAPEVQRIDGQIASIADDDAAARGDQSGARSGVLLASLARSLEAIESMRSDIQDKFDEDLALSKRNEIALLEETNLKNDLERRRALFNSVVDQLKNAQLSSDYGGLSTQLIDPTTVAVERPKTEMFVAMAILGGLGLGTLAAFALESLEGRIGSIAAVKRTLNAPIIGLIPSALPGRGGGATPVGLAGHAMPSSSLAESYRTTRTNLEFHRKSRDAQVVLITSSRPGEGKSTTASNMAISLAHAGRNVLLVDGDLRNPFLHEIYAFPRELGLSDLIENRCTLAATARATAVPGLDLITAGEEVMNPAELLTCGAVVDVLDEARRRYDVIIIDSSPLLPVADAAILAEAVDGVVLVVRMGVSRQHELEAASEILEGMEISTLGVIVNSIERGAMLYGGGYGTYATARNPKRGRTASLTAPTSTDVAKTSPPWTKEDSGRDATERDTALEHRAVGDV